MCIELTFDSVFYVFQCFQYLVVFRSRNYIRIIESEFFTNLNFKGMTSCSCVAYHASIDFHLNVPVRVVLFEAEPDFE